MTPARFTAALLTALAFAATADAAPAVEAAPDSDARAVAGFELKLVDGVPCGWRSTSAGAVHADESIKHGGTRSLRIDLPSAQSSFNSVARGVPADAAITKFELRGHLRVTGDAQASLWLRLDGDQPNLAFAGGDDVPRTGEWIAQTIPLDARPGARTIVFGARMTGSGTVWLDDIELLGDGHPIASVPESCRLTVLDRDHEFDAGSRVALDSLDDRQIDALVLTTRVWGFLKYHHPVITAGHRHWDYDLFRHLRAILAAPDRAAVERELVRWIDGLSSRSAKPAEADCAVPADAPLAPRLAWIDAAANGRALRARLHAVLATRPCGPQFFVALAPGVGNPDFTRESDAPRAALPDAGYRILAAMRFWNMVEYWFPYRDLIDEDWSAVLRDALPRVALARTVADYELEMAAFVARLDDSHANLWSAVARRPPAGPCQLPVGLRVVAGQFVVKGVLPSLAGAVAGASGDVPLRAGDVISSLDGEPVADVVARVRRYYGASNEGARLRDISRALTRGACGAVRVGVRREAEASVDVTVDAERVPTAGLSFAGAFTNDLEGDTFRRLSPDVAYLKLSTIKSADIDAHLAAAADAKSLIVDLRGYPAEFVVFALGERLVPAPTPFARFTAPDLSNPGAFRWGAQATLSPRAPRFEPAVSILVDEMTMSQAEYTALALRAAPGARIIGAPTTGADGNVTNLPLPGGLRAAFSGIGVTLTDGRATQRVGVPIDVPCGYTIAGVRAGRDEILECAMRRSAD